MATKARETLQKAIALKKNSLNWYINLQSAVRAEIKQIQENKDYTAYGKRRMIDELKQKRGIEIMQLIDKRKQAYLFLLNKARKQAEDTIYFSLKKPADDKVKMFEADLKHFKTKLMLSRTANDVLTALKEFITHKIETANENERAYFANKLAEQFDEIISTALSIDKSDAFKLQLRQLYEHLYYDLQTDDVKEAREVLDTVAELLKKPTIFAVGPLLEQNTNELFGARFTRHMNEPEEFFEQQGYTEYKRTYSETDLEAYAEKELKATDE